MTSRTFAPRSQRVKAFFEVPAGYFGRRGFDVRVRADAVGAFTEGTAIGRVLDIGCGNGDVSIPLLERLDCKKLTLLDLSAAMLDLARVRLGAEAQGRVTCLNDDFMAMDFGVERFDLIICVGVFAHVDDPAAVIEKIVGLLDQGGRLIVEVTDSFHPVGRALVLYHAVLGWFRPMTYSLNKLRISQISACCVARGLIASSTYRYCLPPPGSQRLFSHDALYRSIKAVFGSPGRNRRAWMGNVALSRFVKPPLHGASTTRESDPGLATAVSADTEAPGGAPLTAAAGAWSGDESRSFVR